MLGSENRRVGEAFLILLTKTRRTTGLLSLTRHSRRCDCKRCRAEGGGSHLSFGMDELGKGAGSLLQ